MQSPAPLRPLKLTRDMMIMQIEKGIRPFLDELKQLEEKTHQAKSLLEKQQNDLTAIKESKATLSEDLLKRIAGMEEAHAKLKKEMDEQLVGIQAKQNSVKEILNAEIEKLKQTHHQHEAAQISQLKMILAEALKDAARKYSKVIEGRFVKKRNTADEISNKRYKRFQQKFGLIAKYKVLDSKQSKQVPELEFTDFTNMSLGEIFDIAKDTLKSGEMDKGSLKSLQEALMTVTAFSKTITDAKQMDEKIVTFDGKKKLEIDFAKVKQVTDQADADLAVQQKKFNEKKWDLQSAAYPQDRFKLISSGQDLTGKITKLQQELQQLEQDRQKFIAVETHARDLSTKVDQFEMKLGDPNIGASSVQDAKTLALQLSRLKIEIKENQDSRIYFKLAEDMEERKKEIQKLKEVFTKLEEEYKKFKDMVAIKGPELERLIEEANKVIIEAQTLQNPRAIEAAMKAHTEATAKAHDIMQRQIDFQTAKSQVKTLLNEAEENFKIRNEKINGLLQKANALESSQAVAEYQARRQAQQTQEDAKQNKVANEYRAAQMIGQMVSLPRINEWQDKGRTMFLNVKVPENISQIGMLYQGEFAKLFEDNKIPIKNQDFIKSLKAKLAEIYKGKFEKMVLQQNMELPVQHVFYIIAHKFFAELDSHPEHLQQIMAKFEKNMAALQQNLKANNMRLSDVLGGVEDLKASTQQLPHHGQFRPTPLTMAQDSKLTQVASSHSAEPKKSSVKKGGQVQDRTISAPVANIRGKGDSSPSELTPEATSTPSPGSGKGSRGKH